MERGPGQDEVFFKNYKKRVLRYYLPSQSTKHLEKQKLFFKNHAILAGNPRYYFFGRGVLDSWFSAKWGGGTTPDQTICTKMIAQKLNIFWKVKMIDHFAERKL